MGAAEEVEDILRAEELRDGILAAPDWARKPRKLRVPWKEKQRRQKKRVDPRRAEAMERLRLLRVAKRITQEELAEMSGVSRSAIATGERGTHVPNVGTIERLAEALNVPLSELYDEGPTLEELLATVTLEEVQSGTMGVKDAVDVLVRAGVLHRSGPRVA